MCSSRPVLARPVRRRLSSLRYAVTHLLMRSAASFLMSSSMSVSRAAHAASVRDQGAHVLAARGANQGVGLVEVEYAHRQVVIAAQYDRGCVHHVQAVVEHLVVAKPLVAPGARVGGGVRVIHAVDLGG